MHFAHTVRRWVAVLLCLLLCAGCAPQPSDSTPKEDENMTPALESFIKTVPETVEPFVVPAFDIPPQADNVFSTDPCNTDLVLAPQNDGAQNSMADFIGATMMTPAYHLAQGMSILEEGGARVQQMGAKAFKFYLCRDVASNYYQIDDWGELDNSSPMTIAQHRYYRALFAQDIDTFVIGVFTCAPAEELGGKNPAAYFAYRFTEENRQREYKELYELTYYLCKTYAGMGKTFMGDRLVRRRRHRRRIRRHHRARPGDSGPHHPLVQYPAGRRDGCPPRRRLRGRAGVPRAGGQPRP